MKSLGVFIFPGVQTLDLFGPVELLGGFFDRISLTFVAASLDPVVTRHGQRILPDKSIFEARSFDLLLVPGGDSAIEVGNNPDSVSWLEEVSDNADLVMTVCTGSILLAMTGRLDGRRATTNKIDFRDTVHLGPQVHWVKKARWVQDGKFFTSSGVSAGMDMSLAAAAHLFGDEQAEWMADETEYAWHKDPSWDPFAVKSGLVQE
ncbi:MAG: DJ-1/PfpI family protein [Alphaproteobacteria bacterium]|nr:DJ-1/PfpI family protein [Alphaproteobacteria bacterium]